LLRTGIHIVTDATESEPPGEMGGTRTDWGCSRCTSWELFSAEQLRSHPTNSLLIINALGGTEGARSFFLWLREHSVPLPVFAILPEGDVALHQAAMESVDDFLLWPFRPEELKRRIARLWGPNSQDPADVRATLTSECALKQMVGRDPAFLRVLERVSKFARTEAPVLVTGETGTGKELCARVLHQMSVRSRGPFMPLDCGALPDHLFENEVFGHARGAYTDARSEQKGLAALAHRGTLFIDEIDSLSMSAQGKVLRLLQEHTYRPLGSESYQPADVRVIVATNRKLERLVAEKCFRADLFFRINVLRIHMPALRQRQSDIALLSRQFIEDICRVSGLPRKVLSPGALRRLERHDWPGNLRELYNTIQRAAFCSPGAQIASSAIELEEAIEEGDSGEHGLQEFRLAKREAIRSFESRYVRQMLEKHRGNVSSAAREAGKDRRAFGRLAKKYSDDARPE